VIDSEINHPAFATYTQLDAILGYVYPFVSYSGNPAVASINDIDGDRLLDVVESTLGTNSLDSDSDNDGVPDGDEYSLRRIPTDPLIQ